MKKIALILVLVMILLFSSCGGYKNRSSSIHAKDLIAKEAFSIELDVKRVSITSPSQSFAVDKSLEELADCIAETEPSLSVKTYQNVYIEIRTSSNVFLIRTTEKLDEDKEDEYRYRFFAPIAGFKTDEEEYGSYVKGYIPYHLLKELPAIQYYYGIEDAYPQTMECEAVGTIEEFYDFYDHIAHCEVEREGDVLYVTTEEGTATLTFLVDGDTFKVTFFVE